MEQVRKVRHAKLWSLHKLVSVAEATPGSRLADLPGFARRSESCSAAVKLHSVKCKTLTTSG